MMEILKCCQVSRTLRTKVWWVVVMATMVAEVFSISGSHVCTVKQKYNVTKRVKYRAPMSVRTYEWCFSVPPRCSRWTTEMRDLTRLETEERIAEVAVCCPGYKMKDVDCIPVCPHGKTGSGCHEECPEGKWGPNCVHECEVCLHGKCSTVNGDCICEDGWQGESCEIIVSTTILSMISKELLSSTKASTKTTSSSTSISSSISTTPYYVITSSEAKSTESSTIPTIKTRLVTSKTTDSILSTFPPIQKTTSTTTSERNIVAKDKTEFSSTKNNEITSEYNYQNSTESPLLTPTTSMTIFYRPLDVTTQNPIPMNPEVVTKLLQATTKSTPKEIWIKPSQKGESSLVETKTKVHETHQKPKTTKNYSTLPLTTPKTIIVSIIPTSISYSTFKRITLTTAPMKASNYMQKTPIVTNFSAHGDKNISNHSSSTPISLFTIKLLQSSSKKKGSSTSTVNPLLLNTVSKSLLYTSFIANSTFSRRAPANVTNSMTNFINNINTKSSTFYNFLTAKVSTNLQQELFTKRVPYEISTTPLPTKKPISKMTQTIVQSTKTTEHATKSNQSIIIHQNRTLTRGMTLKPLMGLIQSEDKSQNKELEKTKTYKNLTKLIANVSESNTNNVTEKLTTVEDELFHILTEPEHITAVVGDKREDTHSVDLVSVLSIAAGVMMGVITVAVVIVMIERCRRPSYEHVRKMNQVVMENKDMQTYSRSIFHAPLPDLPVSDKCHYQPIETLDRKLKQFMRPVTVQELSPIMLENFRDIIECHYDHLPRRNYNNGALSATLVRAPSVSDHVELRTVRASSVSESSIKTVKYEDLIDHTTSEPLYAEIPDWRPTFQHAVEVVNLNGEAVTEL